MAKASEIWPYYGEGIDEPVYELGKLREGLPPTKLGEGLFMMRHIVNSFEMEAGLYAIQFLVDVITVEEQEDGNFHLTYAYTDKLARKVAEERQLLSGEPPNVMINPGGLILGSQRSWRTLWRQRQKEVGYMMKGPDIEDLFGPELTKQRPRELQPVG